TVVYRAAERLAGTLTTVVVCPAETEREAGVRARSCRRASTVVIRTGIADGRASRPDTTAPPLVISVGRMSPPKDFATLIAALGRLHELEFRALLVGDGPERPALEQLASGLGLTAPRLRFAGAVSDAHTLVAGAACFVLSSSSECLPVS